MANFVVITNIIKYSTLKIIINVRLLLMFCCHVIPVNLNSYKMLEIKKTKLLIHNNCIQMNGIICNQLCYIFIKPYCALYLQNIDLIIDTIP